LDYSKYKAYEVRTNCGYSPVDCYYKIIKRERHIKKSGKLFDTWEWVEMDASEPIEMICEDCGKPADWLDIDNCCEKCSKYSTKVDD
jgi:hypothetical protein